MTEPIAPLEQLKIKYSSGSLYLTCIPINDLTILLNETSKFDRLAAKVFPRESLHVFKAFLDKTRLEKMNDSVAFVQLELGTGKAGFKKTSDQDGVIHPIPWSEPQVWGIAEFCDRFLNKLPVIESARASIAKGTVSLDHGWKTMEELRKDAYIPATRIATIASDLMSLAENKPDELRALRASNPKRYSAIKAFSSAHREFLTKYESAMGVAISDRNLERIGRKGRALRDAKTSWVIETPLAIEQNKKIVNSCNNYKKLFTGVGYSINSTEVDDVNLFRVCRNLTYNVGEPRTVTSLHRRQPTGSLGKLSSVKGRK